MRGRLLPALLMARRNLTRTKLRSALAALGIVIGVIAIASLGMLGATLQQTATQDLGDIGNQLVLSGGEDQSDGVTDRDLRNVERIAGDATVVPFDRSFETIEIGRTEAQTSIYEMSRPSRVYTAREGRVPDPLRRGALVGSSIAERHSLMPGNTLVINETTYQIRGILEEGAAFSPASPNNAIIVPPKRPGGPYDQVIVEAENGQAATEITEEIEETLNRREDRIDVFELGSITENIGEFFGLLNMFLIGIGSISLLVAGVSILNVMLMSTVERREEIGVLRAVGFQRRDVLTVLLTEAALLGVVGGLIGVLVSAGLGTIVAQFALGDALVVFQPSNLTYLAIAFGFGVGTAVLSGLYPAWKAANEHPVEALRS